MPRTTDIGNGKVADRQLVQPAIKRLKEAMFEPVAPLATECWCTPEPVTWSRRRSGRHLILTEGQTWAQRAFDCAWFLFKGKVPAAATGKDLVALIDVGGEACVYEDGQPVRGLTNGSCHFPRFLGEPCKQVFDLAKHAKAGQPVTIWADAGGNDLFGNLMTGKLTRARLAIRHRDRRTCHYDMVVLADLADQLPEKEPRRRRIERALYDAAAILTTIDVNRVAQARAILAPELAKRDGDPDIRITAVGHAHLDLAWLWPLRESKRKAIRTFTTALYLQKRYPEYVFGASQPQQFQWMKDEQPQLYRRIKQAVKAGAIEPQGAMWVEADTNITDGESLVRQVLHGKRFFAEEFGVEVDHLWLPDVFGYSAVLPQILAKSGVAYFTTQKLSWSTTNRFPHHSFRWLGIDGSAVLSYMLPEDTYNAPAMPRGVRKLMTADRDNDVVDEGLMLFGIGDGGGGPGAEHLEHLRRMRDLKGLSPVTPGPAAPFFKRWAKQAGRFATWDGELYLERHQGTLTTHTPMKSLNRDLERELRRTEWLCCVAGGLYPAKALDALWKEALYFQFHDILPGSSIKRVYDETWARGAAMLTDLAKLRERAIKTVIATMPVKRGELVAFNPASWERREWLKTDDGWRQATLPPMGCAILSDATAVAPPPVTATRRRLANDQLEVRFNAKGQIVRLVDRELDCDLLADGQIGNDLVVYQDTGDAWDFPHNYLATEPMRPVLAGAEAVVDGPEARLILLWNHRASCFTQTWTLRAGSRRVEGRIDGDWQTPQSMLRVRFPVAVRTRTATCGIQFGHLERSAHANTTWDIAQEEVPCQGWADLSQEDHGLALLAVAKYGYRVKDGVLDLAILRSAPYPNVADLDQATLDGNGRGYTDIGPFAATFALYPHAGDAVSGQVAREQALLDEEPIVVRASKRGTTGGSMTVATVDPGTPQVAVAAVKQAEDGDGIIIRLVERDGAACQTTLTTVLPHAKVVETDLMERRLRAVQQVNAGIPLAFKPFEIKTILLVSRG